MNTTTQISILCAVVASILGVFTGDGLVDTIGRSMFNYVITYSILLIWLSLEKYIDKETER